MNKLILDINNELNVVENLLHKYINVNSNIAHIYRINCRKPIMSSNNRYTLLNNQTEFIFGLDLNTVNDDIYDVNFIKIVDRNELTEGLVSYRPYLPLHAMELFKIFLDKLQYDANPHRELLTSDPLGITNDFSYIDSFITNNIEFEDIIDIFIRVPIDVKNIIFNTLMKLIRNKSLLDFVYRNPEQLIEADSESSNLILTKTEDIRAIRYNLALETMSIQ